MFTVRVNASGAGVVANLKRRAAKFTIPRLHEAVRRVAVETAEKLREVTPRRWTPASTNLASGWYITTPAQLRWTVANRNPRVLGFLEFGTPRGSPGSYIYPVNSRVLYIPLTLAGSKGWNLSLKPGRDFILRQRVRGITPRRIVAGQRQIAFARFSLAMQRFAAENL